VTSYTLYIPKLQTYEHIIYGNNHNQDVNLNMLYMLYVIMLYL